MSGPEIDSHWDLGFYSPSLPLNVLKQVPPGGIPIEIVVVTTTLSITTDKQNGLRSSSVNYFLECT